MLVILGLLAEGGEYAYELEKRIEARRLRAWTPLAFSSIYALLETAEKRGWAKSRKVKGEEGPKIRAYRLTPKGELALRAAIDERLTVAPVPPAGPSMALMFGGAATAEALEKYASACEAEAKDARERLKHMQGPPSTIRDSIFERSIAFHETEARWARETVARIRQGKTA